MHAFAKEEVLSGHDGIYCSKCAKMTTQRKALSFCRLPPTLVVHMKRSEQGSTHLPLLQSSHR